MPSFGKPVWRALKGKVNALSDPFPYRRFMVRHQTIFVHVPKCAGTSILQALAGRTRPRDHFALSIYQQANEERFEAYFKFAFVRDPVSRIHSVYRYLKNGGNKMGDLNLSKDINRSCNDFDSFCQDWLRPRHLSTIPLFYPQAYFVFDGGKDKIGVDFLGRFEHFDRDLQVVFDRLGYEGEIPSENSSPSGSDAPSETAENIIRELYSIDYEILGYA